MLNTKSEMVRSVTNNEMDMAIDQCKCDIQWPLHVLNRDLTNIIHSQLHIHRLWQ